VLAADDLDSELLADPAITVEVREIAVHNERHA
jgi:hypothetical protein